MEVGTARPLSNEVLGVKTKKKIIHTIPVGPRIGNQLDFGHSQHVSTSYNMQTFVDSTENGLFSLSSLWDQILYIGGVDVMFEGDSSITLTAMNRHKDDSSLLGPIINDIRVLLQVFAGPKLNLVGREANHVCRPGVVRQLEGSWFKEPLGLVSDILIDDTQCNLN